MAKANIPGDLIPWEIIIIIAPFSPISELLRIPKTNIFIWITEEYAISLFMSIEQRQTNPITIAPHKLILKNKFIEFDSI